MVSALVLNTGVVLALVTLGFSLMLCLVSALSWARLRQAKLAIVGGAFLVLAAKGALSAYRAIVLKETDLPAVALDFLVLAFLYAGVAAR